MVKAAHDKGIAVMIDVVANHSGPVGDDFAQIYPLNQSSHYHADCQIEDWSNQWQVENCRLANLPDLDQSNPWVRQYLKDWVKHIVETFDIDGIRIDTIPEVPKDFWSEYKTSAGVFQMGEVFNGDTSYVGDYQNHVDGLFNYPMFFTIKDVFGNGHSMFEFRARYMDEYTKFKDIDALGLFMDNHDNARFLSQFSNRNAFKAAMAFALTERGIPFFYYGDEQFFNGGNDPYCRESLWNAMDTNSEGYKFIATINKARKAAQIWNQKFTEKYVLDNLYAFSRGDLLVGLTNRNDAINVNLGSPWPANTQVCNIFNASDC